MIEKFSVKWLYNIKFHLDDAVATALVSKYKNQSQLKIEMASREREGNACDRQRRGVKVENWKKKNVEIPISVEHVSE